MRIGVFYFPTDYGIHPGELARELEARGFESLFVCEHTHIPVSRRTPFPGGGAGPARARQSSDIGLAPSTRLPAGDRPVVSVRRRHSRADTVTLVRLPQVARAGLRLDRG
jgi:alkanesulfonate monooxygenase SsuD/methylene tetrahydromethanopterin reductase-like flavin-dependent oxidoreductase (luciferase family)